MQQSIMEDRAAINGMIASNGVKELREVEIKSRFGLISVHPEKAISFPHGLPGMPGAVSFCLTDFPNDKHKQFQLLQCLNQQNLSFIVVPSTEDNQLLDQSDVKDACSILGINGGDLLLLFIVTAHESAGGRRLSVNAKAPIFVDSATRTATQYVFQNNNYEIQHYIS